MTRHTLSVLVENKSGVLARVSALFSRRGFNIESLAVGPTEVDEVSRMTIVVDAADTALEQVTKQLNKLIHVLKIVELDSTIAVERELQLRAQHWILERQRVLRRHQQLAQRILLALLSRAEPRLDPGRAPSRIEQRLGQLQ